MSRPRSERIPDRERSRRVIESRARAEQERARMAEEFRRRLESDLTLDGTAAQEWLIQSAVSAAVEVAVLSQRFIRCYATSTEMERLGRARGELGRTLRLLGLPRRSQSEDGSGPPSGASEAERRAWAQQYVANALTEGQNE